MASDISCNADLPCLVFVLNSSLLVKHAKLTSFSSHNREYEDDNRRLITIGFLTCIIFSMYKLIKGKSYLYQVSILRRIIHVFNVEATIATKKQPEKSKLHFRKINLSRVVFFILSVASQLSIFKAERISIMHHEYYTKSLAVCNKTLWTIQSIKLRIFS